MHSSVVSTNSASMNDTILYPSGNYSELDLSFRLTCGEDFYGPECVYCVDTNDTIAGHYSCNRSTGEKGRIRVRRATVGKRKRVGRVGWRERCVM